MTTAQRARPGEIVAIRAAMLTFVADPFTADVDTARRYESDAIVAMANGKIIDCGPADAVAGRLPPGTEVTRYPNALISAGFIDAHVHYPQISVIGAGGKPLLDWLAAYTFPAEERYGDHAYASEVARRYLIENLRHGITTAAVFGTVHPASVDALFEEAERHGTRTICGKVLMDRNAPATLMDTAEGGYEESRALIERWHGRGRLAYAVTPRFAATSTPAQLHAASALWKKFPGTYVQSHVAENHAEVAWIRELFPSSRHYVDVYAKHGLLGRRAVYAHGIHLEESEFQLLHETGTTLAHCPTSNSFLGSGLFELARAKRRERPVPVALGTDIGGGTHFSMLRTMQAACEVAQLVGAPLAPSRAWWLATAGGAEALDLGERIGRVDVGMEADVVVIDLRSTPVIDFRMQHVRDVDEALAVQMALGDDRAVLATYVAGRLAWERDAGRRLDG